MGHDKCTPFSFFSWSPEADQQSNQQSYFSDIKLKKKIINYHVSCSFICEKFEEKKNDPKNCYLILPFSLQSYVREQILQTVAVILKRGTVELKSSNTDRLFEDISQLISSGNVTMVGSHVLHLFIYRLHMKKWAAKSYKHHSCRYMKKNWIAGKFYFLW